MKAPIFFLGSSDEGDIGEGENDDDIDEGEDSLSADDFMSDEDDLDESLLCENDPKVRSTELPLYPGANITVFMAFLVILQYSIRHCLTQKALKELLQLLCAILPSGANIPKSVYAMK